METGSDEKILKPDRTPDVVIRPGHAFWFNEMVLMHVYGQLYKIEVDQADGSFYFTDHGKKRFKLLEAKESYEKWLFETFESKFFGEENE